MRTNYLFPSRFKKFGWILFMLGFILGIMFLSGLEISFLKVKVFSITGSSLQGKSGYFNLIENNILDEISGVLLIIGALLIAFSKEKAEDEFIAKIRLESLVWATYVNYAILIIAIILIYDLEFFWVLVFNMFTMLIFFVIRFNRALYKSKNQIEDEE